MGTMRDGFNYWTVNGIDLVSLKNNDDFLRYLESMKNIDNQSLQDRNSTELTQLKNAYQLRQNHQDRQIASIAVFMLSALTALENFQKKQLNEESYKKEIDRIIGAYKVSVTPVVEEPVVQVQDVAPTVENKFDIESLDHLRQKIKFYQNNHKVKKYSAEVNEIFIALENLDFDRVDAAGVRVFQLGNVPKVLTPLKYLPA